MAGSDCAVLAYNTVRWMAQLSGNKTLCEWEPKTLRTYLIKEVVRTQDVWGAEGISGRVKFLPLAWAGMPKTSFRKNSECLFFCLHLR
jgi:hypothetical protein